jgi:hypothetical protein
MAGILNSKNRIMDVAITEEGRRQLTRGKMQIEFVSFTDRQTFYQGDVASGSATTKDRLFLEATSLPQDQIVFETNAGGSFLSFAAGPLELDAEGHIFHGSGSTRLTETVSSAVYASLTSSLIAQSINNFKNQNIIGTYPLDMSSSFKISNVDYLSFNVTDSSPLTDSSAHNNTTNIVPLIWDERTSFTRLRDFLPPVYNDLNHDSQLFGEWPQLGGASKLESYDDMIKFMFVGKPSHTATQAYVEEPLNPSETILFDSTIPDMNLIMQAFEIQKNATKMTKLDFIDTGYWTVSGGSTVKIVFAGKVYIDSVGMPNFVNIFTLIYNNFSKFPIGAFPFDSDLAYGKIKEYLLGGEFRFRGQEAAPEHRSGIDHII